MEKSSYTVYLACIVLDPPKHEENASIGPHLAD